MEGTERVLLELFIIFAAAKVMGELFERLKQPAVIGEVLVGVVLGPHALGVIGTGPVLQTVATMGVVILLFTVGLQTKPSDLFRVGRTALLVAAGGVVVPFLLGIGFALGFRFPAHEALFVGAALVATSVGISARVLADAGFISSRAARIVLAAAVIDDILGLLVLSVVSGVSAGDGVDIPHVALVVAMAVAFTAFLVFVAPRLVERHVHLVGRLRIRHAPFVVALAIMLGLAALAEAVGLAAIVGAFFAGMAFAETSDRYTLESHADPLAEFLVPFFFVLMGARVDVALLICPAVLLPGLLLTALAILGKLVGCGLGSLTEGRACALAVGVGMIPRGEVGLIVASIGLTLGALSDAVYAQVVLVAILTTLVVPPLLPVLFRRVDPPCLVAEDPASPRSSGSEVAR